MTVCLIVGVLSNADACSVVGPADNGECGGGNGELLREFNTLKGVCVLKSQRTIGENGVNGSMFRHRALQRNHNRLYIFSGEGNSDRNGRMEFMVVGSDYTEYDIFGRRNGCVHGESILTCFSSDNAESTVGADDSNRIFFRVFNDEQTADNRSGLSAAVHSDVRSESNDSWWFIHVEDGNLDESVHLNTSAVDKHQLQQIFRLGLVVDRFFEGYRTCIRVDMEDVGQISLNTTHNTVCTSIRIGSANNTDETANTCRFPNSHLVSQLRWRFVHIIDHNGDVDVVEEGRVAEIANTDSHDVDTLRLVVQFLTMEERS